ncbi:MAG: hydroxymethylbilane synthase [Elusimicrobia bacterium]|nr:hydroxymethylbilane synthase [Elusimicrobiota bacterium]
MRYGTRGSALALAQSGMVARALERAAGRTIERVVITTSGDRFSREQPPEPSSGAAPNVKAMFVKEIEEALLAGTIDFAVHSAKDMPAALPEGLIIAAVPAREDPRDAFIPGPGVGALSSVGPGAVIATGSVRRQAQLRLACPQGVSFQAIRGNVDTRLKRVERGEFAGIVLAVAGLKRLGLGGRAHEPLPPELVVPAPGQGALVLEARADRPEALAALRTIDDERTRLELDCERALLAAMGGGCQTPLGALARVAGGRVALRAFWMDGSGKRAVARAAEGPAAEGPALARRLADELLAAARA